MPLPPPLTAAVTLFQQEDRGIRLIEIGRTTDLFPRSHLGDPLLRIFLRHLDGTGSQQRVRRQRVMLDDADKNLAGTLRSAR